MTNDIKEQLSALLDDELSPEALRLLSQIPDSQELRSTWDSFYLIGDVLRGRERDSPPRASPARFASV